MDTEQQEIFDRIVSYIKSYRSQLGEERYFNVLQHLDDQVGGMKMDLEDELLDEGE